MENIRFRDPTGNLTKEEAPVVLSRLLAIIDMYVPVVLYQVLEKPDSIL